MPIDNKKRDSQGDDLLTEKIEEMIKRMFKQHEENIGRIISANLRIMNDKFDELNKKIEDFKVSLEFTEKELKDEIASVKEKHEVENKFLRDKVRELEDRSRRNNIRIEGLKESENETWETTTRKVEDIITNRLGIKQKVIIERSHRGGKKQMDKFTGKPRTIFAKILDYRDKELIMQNAKKLKGSGIFINEDYSKETMEIRKGLWMKVKKLRDEGMYAYIQYDKVISRPFKK